MGFSFFSFPFNSLSCFIYGYFFCCRHFSAKSIIIRHYTLRFVILPCIFMCYFCSKSKKTCFINFKGSSLYLFHTLVELQFLLLVSIFSQLQIKFSTIPYSLQILTLAKFMLGDIAKGTKKQ